MTASDRQFGDLAPLLAPRSVAVIGASDRAGNLGGLAVGFLQKFGFRGPVWPVNAGRDTVAGLKCFPTLADLPAVPDLAVIAVPADAVQAVVADCIAATVPAAVVWAGGFAEGGEAGKTRHRDLEKICRGSSIKLCGPNCIGVINTTLGMTASFSSLMTELEKFTPGSVSMVSQSGGIAVNAHARAQQLGLGFRLTISCGNEAALGIPDFMQALIEDDGTKVIAIYTEGISDPAGLVAALAEAKRRRKPVVMLKAGVTEAAGRAALAHTGRLAGSDRTYDAIFREFAAIRVASPEEMLDIALQLASLPGGRLPVGNRVLLSSFGGGAGVIATDQCAREGLAVPPRSMPRRDNRCRRLLTPLASTLNPVDLTPGTITNPNNREKFPQALDILANAPGTDQMLFFASGMGKLAPEVADMFETMRRNSAKPVGMSWQAPPDGIVEQLAEYGVMTFTEHSRLIRAAGHMVRYQADLQHRIRVIAVRPAGTAVAPTGACRRRAGVFTEDAVAAGVLETCRPSSWRAAALPEASAKLVRVAERVSASRSRSRRSRRRSPTAPPPAWWRSTSARRTRWQQHSEISRPARPNSAPRWKACGCSTCSPATSSCWSPPCAIRNSVSSSASAWVGR